MQFNGTLEGMPLDVRSIIRKFSSGLSWFRLLSKDFEQTTNMFKIQRQSGPFVNNDLHGLLRLVERKNPHLYPFDYKFNALDMRESELGDEGLVQLCAILNHTNCNVTHLNLSKNSISNIGCLNTLINLESLDPNDNNITDISGLATLVNLKELNLRTNHIKRIAGFATLINLEKLIIGNNGVSVMTGLSTLINLKELNIDRSWITSIAGLDNLVNLETLQLGDNPLTAIEGFKNLTCLKTLDITTVMLMMTIRTLELQMCHRALLLL